MEPSRYIQPAAVQTDLIHGDDKPEPPRFKEPRCYAFDWLQDVKYHFYLADKDGNWHKIETEE